MKWYSQSGQDEFAYFTTNKKEHCTFLDIGSGGPTSNTRALEELGWTGWRVDVAPDLNCRRVSTFFIADATEMLFNFLPSYVDYLSLDVDDESYHALLALPLDRVRFGCITAEHDFYRFGETLRTPMRKCLERHGYSIMWKDVEDQGLIYEDWWV